MCHHCGGGALISVVGSEVTTYQISGAVQQAFSTFVSWFKPSTAAVQAAPETQQQNINIWGNLKEKLESVWSWTETFLKGIVMLIKSEHKFWQDLISGRRGSSLPDQSNQKLDIDWREFFNGVWILFGFKYADIFEVESFTFLYLMKDLFLDSIQDWKWERKSFSDAWENLEKKFQPNLKNLLIFLAQLSATGKGMRMKSKGQIQQDQSQHSNTKIKLVRRNLKNFALGLSWIAPEALSSPEEK
ncbi:hypothetical protein [Mycoplasma suis]|uniref:Uncharacterized protein n=1 Tax=Mycoplasma suis (strain Illinois) TaxID=768700 RepID=F0QRZ2_MYCSL|nr:hypothetical protein [Mycoplasma suis]ADX98262.1 hypothetical protein MSU_0737 [Mycoplasma suis str. Illinois]